MKDNINRYRMSDLFEVKFVLYCFLHDCKGRTEPAGFGADLLIQDQIRLQVFKQLGGKIWNEA